MDLGTKDVYGYTPYAELTKEEQDKRDTTGDNGPWHVIGTEPRPLDTWAREEMQYLHHGYVGDPEKIA